MDGDFSATRFLVEDPVVGLEGVLRAGSGRGIIGGSWDNSLDGTADGGMEESGLSRIQWLKSLSVLCTQLMIVKTAFCISPGEEGCGAGAVALLGGVGFVKKGKSVTGVRANEFKDATEACSPQ